MSVLTMRRSIERHRVAFKRCVAGVALFAAANLAVAETATVATSAVPQMRAAPSKPATPTWDLANIDNPRVDEWVRRFTNSLRNDFTATLARGSTYHAMISQKLAARRMPSELIYLAMIESGFRSNARSRASAVGLWQFIASTARRFGLSVGNGYDDRTNPAKETDAALTYLAQLHDRFKSWYLAAAAYNAGPGKIAKALRRVTGNGVGTDRDFYRIAPYLPIETRDYVPKLIAAARIGKAPVVYGLRPSTG